MDKNKSGTNNRKIKAQQNETIMMSDLLSAISENEYPAYIIETVETVQKWMSDAVNHHKNENGEDHDEFINSRRRDSGFAGFLGEDFEDFEEDDVGSVEDLYSRLSSIEEFADVIQNSKKTGGNKSDAIIISIDSPNYESGLRSAIDHAAIFNRGNCKRFWIISDSFVFGEVVNFMPHVEALAEQGTILRFLLVTPWGWIELPLSEAGFLSRSSSQFLWNDAVQGQKRQK